MVRTMMLMVSVALAAALVSACGSPLSLAVENHDPTAYLLRVVDGRHRAWRVPPGSAGTGPLSDGTDMRFVILSSIDCTELGRLGLGSGEHTLIVEGGELANPDMRGSIDPTLEPLEQIVDPCP